MNGTCGDPLTGLFPGVTLRCELERGHHGRHEDRQLGMQIEWNDNAWAFPEEVPA